MKAYIDPNTGGMLFQVLAAALAALSALALIFSRHIRVFLARLRRSLRDLRGRSNVGQSGARQEAESAHDPSKEA